MNWRRTGILALFDLRHSLLRLKGLVFLIPFAFFWYWILKALFEDKAQHLVSSEGIAVVSMLFNAEIAQTLFIFHPPTLSVFFMLALSTAPFFAMLASNNQTAGDAGRKSLRLFLGRCSRSEIYFGRFISSYMLVTGSILVVAAITTAISMYNDDFGTAKTLAYAAETTGLTLVYFLPYIAFMAMVSSFMGSALSTLLMATILYLVLIITTGYVNEYSPVEISLLPNGIKQHLFNIHPEDMAYAIGGSISYTVIFGAIGWWLFQRRNI